MGFFLMYFSKKSRFFTNGVKIVAFFKVFFKVFK